MKRSIIYPLATVAGFLVGAAIGIDGRNCSHPEQPPLLQCATEDPPDVLIPAIGLALLSLAIVGSIDVVRSAIRNRPDPQIPGWRRWLYLVLLVFVAVPAARIGIEQALGGYSDGDPLLIWVLGTWILTPVILVEYVVWLIRRWRGLKRWIPFVALLVIGVLAFAVTGDPDLACIDNSSDNSGCYDGMHFYITNYVLLCVMVGSFFLAIREPDGVSQDEVTRPTRA